MRKLASDLDKQDQSELSIEDLGISKSDRLDYLRSSAMSSYLPLR